MVLANVPLFRFSLRRNMRTYPRSSFRCRGTSVCTLVPVFVPGERPPKPPFWKTTLLSTPEQCATTYKFCKTVSLAMRCGKAMTKLWTETRSMLQLPIPLADAFGTSISFCFCDVLLSFRAHTIVVLDGSSESREPPTVSKKVVSENCSAPLQTGARRKMGKTAMACVCVCMQLEQLVTTTTGPHRADLVAISCHRSLAPSGPHRSPAAPSLHVQSCTVPCYSWCSLCPVTYAAMLPFLHVSGLWLLHRVVPSLAERTLTQITRRETVALSHCLGCGLL